MYPTDDNLDGNKMAECDREAVRQSDDEVIARLKLASLHHVPNGEPEARVG